MDRYGRSTNNPIQAEIIIEIARDFREMKHFLQQVNDPDGPSFSPYHMVKARLAMAGRDESDHADAQAINRHHLKQAKAAFILAKATYLHDAPDVEKLHSLGRKICAAHRRSKK